MEVVFSTRFELSSPPGFPMLNPLLANSVQMDAHSTMPSPAASGSSSAAEPAIPQNWLDGGIALLDSAGALAEANDALVNWLDKPKPSLVGLPFWDLLGGILPECAPALSDLRTSPKAFERILLKSSQPAHWLHLETARRDGHCFVRLNSTLPPLSELEEAAWDEHMHGTSARREMYVRLLRAEAQLDRLLRRWPCVVFSQRSDFSLQFASPNIQELTGVTVAQWTSQPRRFWELIHEQDAVELRQQYKTAVQNGADITNTFRIRHAQTGRVVYILEHRQPVISKNGLLLSHEVVWLDVTRQTVAENRLSTAAWKETLAVLTLGMAHDFRNIMAGIHSLSESYLSQITDAHPFREGLSLIQKNSGQASQLVQRMINLHLGQAGERAYHDLNEIARDILDLVVKILPRRIKLASELSTTTLPVYADVVELRQAVINLLLNAADAMPKGGNLAIVSSRHTELPKFEHMKGITPRLPCVCLTIRDTGTGIKPRYLGSIFDPFFTTKPKGSGLGLYNARIAMEKHQGAISVESKEGVGTTFHLWLPEADLSAPAPATAQTAVEMIERRTILLAGQSGEVLDRTAEFLRSSNYHVVLVTSPESLSELLQSPDYQFSAAILLGEPPLPAMEPFYREIRQQDTEIKIVLKLAGCGPDEPGIQLFNGAELILNSDLPETDILQKLGLFIK